MRERTCEDDVLAAALERDRHQSGIDKDHIVSRRIFIVFLGRNIGKIRNHTDY